MLLILLLKFENNKLINFFKNINFLTILSFCVGLWLFAQILNTPIIVAYRIGVYGFSFFLGYFFSNEENIKHLESNYLFL